MVEAWRDELTEWLAPFVGMLGDRRRARMCPAYVEGLIGPGDRKSVQPMAMRSPGIGYDQLHHFIGGALWDSAPLEEELCRQADALVGGSDAWLIIDDTALPKKGRASVGVAPQYASALGKNANCQTLVSVTLASNEVPVMIGLRLFLPESWTSDAARMDRAKVPAEARAYRTKPDIALAEIDRVRSAGVRFGGILADAGYGLSGPFRQALTERGLTWAVGIPYKQKVYPADVAMIFPVAGRGRPRKNHVPDVASRPAQEVLESAKWQTVSWRRGTKGKLSARFAAMRVRVADGPPQRIGDLGQQHLPGEEVWLVGEHRSTGERKYYLSNLPVDTPLRKLAGAIKARWVCEQAHQQLKEELGLDHFEGRSWKGLHRHTLMSMIAFPARMVVFIGIALGAPIGIYLAARATRLSPRLADLNTMQLLWLSLGCAAGKALLYDAAVAMVRPEQGSQYFALDIFLGDALGTWVMILPVKCLLTLSGRFRT